MTLSDETFKKVHAYWVTVGRKYIDDNLGKTSLAELRPFHARLMPGPFAAWAALNERSFSTRTGTWFQDIARVVARQFHPVAETKSTVAGNIRPAAQTHIEAILGDMDYGNPRRVPDRTKDLAEVVSVQGSGGTATQTISDLHVKRADGVELYFEMKTPQPNKGQCVQMKRQMLTIAALRASHVAEAYAAAAYNPFGDGKPYTWNYALQFMEPHKDFLVGREFWTKIGDGQTYEDLLTIAETAGEELTAYLETKVVER